MASRRPRIALPGITAILVKELRGRMRGRRAFVSVTIYVLIVAGFAGMVGRILEESVRQNFGFSPEYQSASIGRGIFISLMYLQTLMIAVLAPASTAGTISGERERQTLDLLAVTPISSLAIVVGKLLSSLTWVFVLILASIPVAALVFVYGGVAPDDLLRGYALLFVTATAFGALGIFFSALVRRSGAATGLTFVSILVATVGLTFVWVFLRVSVPNNLDGPGLAANRPPEALLYLNPFVGQADVACGAEGGTGSWCSIIAEVTGTNPSFGQPVPVALGVAPDGGIGQACVSDGTTTKCTSAVAGPGLAAPDAIANDVVADPASLRDRYWPRSALTLLLVSLGFTVAAVQLITPARRWRPHLPGPRRRPRAKDSA
ncbi:MAG: ABC transporter permease subunit [Chloroflexi bacterium]|nr:ABC transporter permease subunit [Chloroflexota bacterium]